MQIMQMYQDKGIPYLVAEREMGDYVASSPEEASEVINTVFKASILPEEHVFLICMNTACKVTALHEVSKGSVNSSIVDLKAIMQRALLSGAVNIIVAHNHPSGDPSPSWEDDDVCKRLKKASDIMNVGLCDFIIIGKHTYSYAEEGRM